METKKISTKRNGDIMKYVGAWKNISDEKIEEMKRDIKEMKKKSTVEWSRRIGDTIEKSAGIWKDIDETGEEYQRRIRKSWAKRRKKLDW